MRKSKVTAETKVSAKTMKAATPSTTKTAKTAKSKKSTVATVSAVTVTATVSTGRNANRKGMSYAKLTPAQKMEVISARKRRGDNSMVATKLGVDSKLVSSVVTGRKSDMRVINAMYNTVRGRKVTA
jgi:hypothetical protein